MSNKPPGTVSRLLLAIALSVAGPLLVLPVAGLLVATGFRSDTVIGGVALAALLLGLTGAAACAPRVLAVAASYTMIRRVVAGFIGFAAAIVVSRALVYLGIDGDALSHQASPWALVEDTATTALFCATLVLATFLALGRPRHVSAGVAQRCR